MILFLALISISPVLSYPTFHTKTTSSDPMHIPNIMNIEPGNQVSKRIPSFQIDTMNGDINLNSDKNKIQPINKNLTKKKSKKSIHDKIMFFTRNHHPKRSLLWHMSYGKNSDNDHEIDDLDHDDFMQAGSQMFHGLGYNERNPFNFSPGNVQRPIIF